MNCSNLQKTFLEQKVKELFDRFENCALEHFKEIPNISKTYFEHDCLLEIMSEQHFLKLTFDSEAEESLVELDYTAKDLKPLKGKIINKRTFQGFINKLFLFEDKWYYLNPSEFWPNLSKTELELTDQIIKERIFKDIFEN